VRPSLGADGRAAWLAGGGRRARASRIWETTEREWRRRRNRNGFRWQLSRRDRDRQLRAASHLRSRSSSRSSFRDGWVRPPTAPVLGIRLTTELGEKYRFVPGSPSVFRLL